jgi:hypothetical protein
MNRQRLKMFDVGSMWVSEREYAQRHGLARQTLCNWRHRDRKAGRDHALPGHPVYRRFGRAVRYWLGDQNSSDALFDHQESGR